MRIDMYTGICAGVQVDAGMDVRIGMGTDVRADTCVHIVCTWTGVSTCLQACGLMCVLIYVQMRIGQRMHRRMPV